MSLKNNFLKRDFIVFISFQETTTQVPVSEVTTMTEESKTTIESKESGDVLNITISSNLDYNVSSGNESRNANITDIEDVVSNTSQADDTDYDAYDYSEPKLPPSLPNLV